MAEPTDPKDPYQNKALQPGNALSGDLSTPEKILSMMKDYAVGAIRGVTTDLAGSPVDVINLIASPVTKALGIYSDEPLGGSKDLRKRTGQPTEDTPTEMMGNLLTPGGAAHAVILSAAKLGKNVDAAVKIRDRVRTGMLEAGKTIREAEVAGNAMSFMKEGVYWDKADTMKLNPKAVLSDADANLNPAMLARSPTTGEVRPLNVGSDGIQNTVGSLFPGRKELYNAYPDLQQTLVNGGIPDRSGSYNARTNIISAGAGSSEEGMKGTLLHEIQHAIQTTDKVSAGSNPTINRTFKDTTIQKLGEKYQELSMQKEYADISGNKFEKTAELDALSRYIAKAKLDDSRAYTKYLNNPGEQEARFTQENISLSQQDLSQKVLSLIRQGKTPQSWDTRPMPDSPIANVSSVFKR